MYDELLAANNKLTARFDALVKDIQLLKKENLGLKKRVGELEKNHG